MSTVFTTNPIRVNIISTKNTIKQTVVFIGIVPKEVQAELEKLEKNKTIKQSVLNKFYGKNWSMKLGVDTHKSVKGGDEFSFDNMDDGEDNDDEEDIIVDGLIDDIADESSKDPTTQVDELKKLRNIEPDDDFQQQPNNQFTMNKDSMISLDDLDEDIVIPIQQTIQPHTFQITKTESSQTVKFIFSEPAISLYPEDSVLEFKKKLYCTLNIPVFRQHIWYVYQGRVYPLNYSIFIQNSLEYINVQDLLTRYNNKTDIQLIENLPVDTRYYQSKNSFKITTMDTFSILDDYFHKYNVSEYNLLDLDDFIAPSRQTISNIVSERYQLELIYYGFVMIYWPMLTLPAFSEYLKSEANMPKIYPDLQQPVAELTHIYKLEKKIMDTKYNLINNPDKRSTLKKIHESISNGIIQANINVLKYQNSKDMILFIRNLFDRFPLSDKVIASKCYTQHNGRNVILNKSYKQYPSIKEVMPVESIMFKIKIDTDTTKTLSLILYPNGNYMIKSTWREESQYDFDDIFKIVKLLVDNIVEKINSFGDYVLSNGRTIPLMTKNNTKFTEIGMSIFYKKKLTPDQFNTLISIMQDYRKAGIVRDRSVAENSAEYYFSKGMYQFQADRIEHVITVDNYYEFLTDGLIKQKWYTVFEKTRITKLFHRFADVKIEIVGIKEKEFFIFYNFIVTLFYIFTNQDRPTSKTSTVKNNNQLSVKKALRNLKEQDPVLYKYKKLYNTKNIYSKICQKPYQPLLLDKAGYDELPKGMKSNAVKYWNFTTNKDAYYACPNPKYPYIKFITKRHPKDYCIPCCKKTQVSSNPKDPIKVIYDICMKNHKYEKDKQTITLGSRYVMTYGKDVEPGRLSKLPENSLESLFYETYSLQDQGIDQECTTDDGYYLYGVEQCINGIPNVGILNILINAMELSLNDFIANLVKLVKNTPNKFRILLNGKINRYFRNMNHFISTLQELFLEPNPINEYSEIPWNAIFINMAYLFLNINIVHFTDQKSSNVKLLLPSYITSTEQFLSPEFNNIIVIKKRKKYFPIYLLNVDIFFKLRVITKKIFNYADNIMVIMSKLIGLHFNSNAKKQMSNTINLSIVTKFIEDNPYEIKKLFINSNNMCYYIHLAYTGSSKKYTQTEKNNIYLPIELSYHIISEKTAVTYDMFSRKKYSININAISDFISDFNHWIAIQSELAGLLNTTADRSLPLEKRVQPIYPYIEIQEWLVLAPFNKMTNNSTVIGFKCNNIHYYTNDIKLPQALKIKNEKLSHLFYDPDIVNKTIFTKTNAIMDKRCNKVGKSIYSSNLYQLLMLEFMTLFNKQRNGVLRQKIKKTLLGNLNKNFDDIMSIISELIKDCDDYNKIKSQICEFINTHHNKNLLFNEIHNTFYRFDRTLFEQIKKLPKEKLYNELLKLSNKFITYGDVNKIKNFEFPNMYISCQSDKSSTGYCKKNKFIIEKTKLKHMLEIMTADILNPLKEKWLFSNIFSGNSISFYKFIRRSDELITIEIED